MRFLKIFTTILIAFLVVFAGAALVMVEGRLRYASYVLERDFSFLSRYAAQEDHWYLMECLDVDPEKQVVSDGDGPLLSVFAYQLRFTSDTEYLIEAECLDRYKKPVEIRSGHLPLGIAKSGGAGVAIRVGPGMTGLVDGYVRLVSYFRTRYVGLFSGKVDSRAKVEREDYGRDAPTTTCEGWGFVCCAELVEVGAGNEESRVIDCKGSCFQSCKSRPVPLFFNTNPLMDQQKRILTLNDVSNPVSFGFEFIDADGQVEKVKLNFGDGEEYEHRAAAGVVDHVYKCLQPQCVYTARVLATDNDGYQNESSRLSQITVVVDLR